MKMMNSTKEMSSGNYGNNIMNLNSDTKIKILRLKISDSKHKVTQGG